MSLYCGACGKLLVLEPPYPAETACKEHGGSLEPIEAPEPISRAERDEQRAEERQATEQGEAGHGPPKLVLPEIEPQPRIAGSPPIATAALAAAQTAGVANLQNVKDELEAAHAKRYEEAVQKEDAAKADAAKAGEDERAERGLRLPRHLAPPPARSTPKREPEATGPPRTEG